MTTQASATTQQTGASVATGNGDRFNEVELRGVPEGLRARVRRQLREDAGGRAVEVHDPKGRRKLERVYLFCDEPDPTIKPTERDLTFLLGGERRAWGTVVGRYGDEQRAWKRACELARHGAVEIECEVVGLTLAPPICWRLTTPWVRRRKQRSARRTNERADWAARAQAAAATLSPLYPQLAHALETEIGPVVREVLVRAAENLLAGVSSAGPRAFSQRHFSATKKRDDVGRILARCEVELAAQIELGVLRAGRTGLSGPIELHSLEGVLRFSGIRGPTDVRLDQPGLSLTCHSDTAAGHREPPGRRDGERPLPGPGRVRDRELHEQRGARRASSAGRSGRAGDRLPGRRPRWRADSRADPLGRPGRRARGHRRLPARQTPAVEARFDERGRPARCLHRASGHAGAGLP